MPLGGLRAPRRSESTRLRHPERRWPTATGLTFLLLTSTAALLLLVDLSVRPQPTAASVGDWPAYHRDAARSGFDPSAPDISLGARPDWISATLDARVYAEPLYVGGQLIVATENNSIYKLDASTGAILPGWPVSLGPAVPLSAIPCGNIDPVGVTSTPVVDTTTNTLYVVGLFASPTIHHELYALNLSDGTVVFHRPIDAPGSTPPTQNQRSALALASGTVYVAFGGRFSDCNGDLSSFRGYVVGASATDPSAPLAVYAVPTTAGGIWAPNGPSVDTTNHVYVTTGNSISSTSFDHGESVVRLAPSLAEEDFWAPQDWVSLNALDLDMGSASPELLDNGIIFQVGKSGIGYLLNAASLGHVGSALFSAPLTDPVSGTACGESHGGVASVPPMLYVSCEGAVMGLRMNLAATPPSFSVAWRGVNELGLPAAGAPIATSGAVWSIDIGNGLLNALDPASGVVLYQFTLPGLPANLSTPTSGGARIYAPSGQKIAAFLLGQGSAPPTATPTGSPTPIAAATPLAGDNAFEVSRDSDAGGEAEAFQYTATSSGSAAQIYVYLDASSATSRVIVGLYNDLGNNPGMLLAQTAILVPTPGAWNTAPIPSTSIAAGSRYWIAVLSPNGTGTVAFRDVAAGGLAQTNAQAGLSALPATWSPGTVWRNSPMSAYVAAAPPASVTPTLTPTLTPTPSVTPTLTPGVSPTDTPTSTPTASVALTGTPTDTPTSTPTPTVTPTLTPPPSVTPTVTPTLTPTPSVTPTVTPTSTAVPITGPLAGDTAVEASRDTDSAGEAEAFQYTATTTGSATQLFLYVDASSTASRLNVGLYNDLSNAPGMLLAQGAITAPTAAAWNVAAIPATSVTAGARYWIAVLSPSGAGTLAFRDVATGGLAQTNAQLGLASLPGTWAPGPVCHNAPMSAYIAAGPAGPPTVTPTLTPTSVVVPTVTPTLTPTPSVTPTVTPTVGVAATVTPTATPTPSVTPTVTPTPSGGVTLLGDASIEANFDTDAAGEAEALQYTALATGSVTALVLYVEPRSTASRIVVGLYADTSNNPTTLLTTATIISPVAGGWNRISVPPAAVTAGEKYWIAMLSPSGSGTLAFRDVARGGLAQGSAQLTLGALPATWSTGGRWANSPLSAYAVQSP